MVGTIKCGSIGIHMKFICDDMLGRLAKWLRMLGFDTLYFNTIADAELLRLSLQEERILITRDTHLPGRYMLSTYIVIKHENYMQQLKQVIETLHIEPSQYHLFSRCLMCNRPIEPIRKNTVKDKVPPYVYKTQHIFYTCMSCKKIFWHGTHRKNTLEKLQKANLC